MSESSVPPLPDSSPAPGGTFGQPVPPPPGVRAVPPPPPAPRSARASRPILRVFLVLMFLGSILLNLVLLAAVVVMAAEGTGGMDTALIRAGSGDQIVAVFEVNGVIAEDKVSEITALWNHVSCNNNVKAIVLRVNSPGGSVSECDQIYQMLKNLKEKHGKALVVSMGSMAASGGYYISAPADEIYAEPTTVTGSIGVMGGWAVLKGTMEKIGVEMVLLRSTPARAWKASQNPFERPADYQIAELQGLLDQIHQQFEDIVRTERKNRITIETARNTYKDADGKEFVVEETTPFNGKVYLAEEAAKIGLVDEIGYLDDAIDAAVRQAGLNSPKVVHYRRHKSLGEKLGVMQASAGVGATAVEAIETLQTPKLMMMWKVGG